MTVQSFMTVEATMTTKTVHSLMMAVGEYDFTHSTVIHDGRSRV